MVESFVGKWKVDLSTTTGLQEMGAALGTSDEKQAEWANLNYSIEFALSGETITATVAYDGAFPSHTYNFQVGDTFDFHVYDGREAKLTITMEGGKMVEDYKLGEGTWQTVRQVDGNVLTATTTIKGKTVVQKLIRQ